jgi:hypothetical protein
VRQTILQSAVVSALEKAEESVTITVAERSKVFARSNTGIVISNPIQVINACVLLFCDCIVLCIGSGLATG